MQKFILTLFAASTFLLATVTYAHAETPSARDDLITLDGKQYTKSELTDAFIESAFSDFVWGEDTSPGGRKVSAQATQKSDRKFSNSVDARKVEADYPGSAEKRYPWMAGFFNRPYEDLPRVGALNKWPSSIVRVGIDWPVYGLDLSEADVTAGETNKKMLLRQTSYASAYQAVYNKIEKSIEKAMPEIEAASGLKLVFNKPFSEEERSEDYARIRIIPVSYLEQRNFFKFYKHDPFSRYSGKVSTERFGILDQEYRLYGGVPFTPYVRSQVDGYFLPDNKNQILFAVCKVSPLVNTEILTALISECLMRALGLPEEIKESKTLLGLWNSEYDAYSKLLSLDGDSAYYEEEIDQEGLFKKYGHDRRLYLSEEAKASFASLRSRTFYPEEGDFPHIKKPINAELLQSEYDRFMLSLLYCDALKPGMNRAEALQVLQSACWKPSAQ